MRIMKMCICSLQKLLLRIPERSPIRDLSRRFYMENVLSSRVIEYPLIFEHLDLPRGSRILDVGCCYSLLPIHLASLGYEVYGIDVETYYYHHRNFKFFKRDVRRTGFPDDFFDLITAVSSVEHVGMGFSFSQLKNVRAGVDLDGDKKAVEEMTRILRPGGSIMLTVPFGKWMLRESERIYDEVHLRELLTKLRICQFELFYKDGHDWVPASIDEVSGRDIEAFAFVVAEEG